MDSLLEQKRMVHERRERLEMAIVDEMIAKRSSHKEQLDSQHRQKRLLDRYLADSKLLVELYKRPPEITRDDLNEACNDFYTQLKKITDQHAGYEKKLDDDEPAEEPELELTTPIVEIKTTEKLVEFTDEEAYGRYFDLNKCHEALLQVVKNDEFKPNYMNFLQNFHQFHTLPRHRKLTQAYKNYVEELLEYFRDYSRRARPLFDYEDLENKANEEFEQAWRSRSLLGWFDDQDKDNTESQQTNLEPMIDLESYRLADELKALGLECLKKELQVRGLKCGGTLDERVQRLWQVRGKESHEIDPSLKAGAGSSLKSKGKKRQTIESKTIASIEAKLLRYADIYSEHLQATIENVQRKQARTADERNESDEDISDIEEEDDEDNQNDVVYNPKNLPLGWDGKPIPYWLYKLHGLNLTYHCEICGNATYKGPKTFQRHFAEQRHSHGMKCLGIPNTAHFVNITKIQDAITLWEKLKNEKQKDQFVPQVEEEYEDSQGNVVNKKTYEDLKRQGLL